MPSCLTARDSHCATHALRSRHSATLLGTLPDALAARAAAAATPGTSAWLSRVQRECEGLCARDYVASQLFWQHAPLPGATQGLEAALTSNGALLMVRAGCMRQALACVQLSRAVA